MVLPKSGAGQGGFPLSRASAGRSAGKNCRSWRKVRAHGSAQDVEMALSSMLRRWLQRNSDLRALDALGPDARQGLASDLGITEPALCRIAANGPGASEELPKLLE